MKLMPRPWVRLLACAAVVFGAGSLSIAQYFLRIHRAPQPGELWAYLGFLSFLTVIAFLSVRRRIPFSRN